MSRFHLVAHYALPLGTGEIKLRATVTLDAPTTDAARDRLHDALVLHRGADVTLVLVKPAREA